MNLKWRIWLPWIIQPIVLKKWNWKQWYIIDAAKKPLGRVAAEAAKLLRGKHKPTYTPNIDVGDHVIIINCEKVVLTGRKLDQKIYRSHSGYIGGMKETTARDLLAKSPEKWWHMLLKVCFLIQDLVDKWLKN